MTKTLTVGDRWGIIARWIVELLAFIPRIPSSSSKGKVCKIRMRVIYECINIDFGFFSIQIRSNLLLFDDLFPRKVDA